MAIYFGNPITVGGGGTEEFNATFICPPYCLISGTCDISGDKEFVSWEVGDFTSFQVTLVTNATYALKCEVDIPFRDNTVRVTASEISFQTGTTLTTYSFIPEGAVFFFGWENPNYERQLYTTPNAGGPGAGTYTYLRYRNGTATNSTAIAAANVFIPVLNRQNHCYESNLYTDYTSGTVTHPIGYETIFPRADADHTCQTFWGNLYWPAETTSSSTVIMRWDCSVSSAAATTSAISEMVQNGVSAAGPMGMNVTFTNISTNATITGTYGSVKWDEGLAWLSYCLNSNQYRDANNRRVRYSVQQTAKAKADTARFRTFIVVDRGTPYIPPEIAEVPWIEDLVINSQESSGYTSERTGNWVVDGRFSFRIDYRVSDGATQYRFYVKDTRGTGFTYNPKIEVFNNGVSVTSKNLGSTTRDSAWHLLLAYDVPADESTAGLTYRLSSIPTSSHNPSKSTYDGDFPQIEE